MKMSKMLIRTQREVPKEATCPSHVLLLRGGYIYQTAAGVYSFLPLGLRTINKISDIIRQKMDNIGGQEILMPVLQPKELWDETGRWKTFEPPLFKTKDIQDKEFTLGPTHEEVLVDIIRNQQISRENLPFMLYQIQAKFRNELRSTGGLLRTREILMKDAYSFHADKASLDKQYQEIIKSYRKIFEKAGLKTVLAEADSGSIGGAESAEFMALAETGESKVAICQCGYEATIEVVPEDKKCPKCRKDLEFKNAIEVGHIFKLGDIYSKKMQAFYTNDKDEKKPLIMGCYGIGVGRLMATIVECYHDEFGIKWPVSCAPYKFYLIDLTKDGLPRVQSRGEELYQKLIDSGEEVLFDDRVLSAGVKFADADLLGIPYRIVISEKTGEKIELKKREVKEVELVEFDNLKNL